MKKRYIIPTNVIHHLQARKMLAESVPVSDETIGADEALVQEEMDMPSGNTSTNVWGGGW